MKTDDSLAIGDVFRTYERCSITYAIVRLDDSSVVELQVGDGEGRINVVDGKAYVNSLECQECGEDLFRDKKQDEWYCPIHD